jgi:hypothetical protein
MNFSAKEIHDFNNLSNELIEVFETTYELSKCDAICSKYINDNKLPELVVQGIYFGILRYYTYLDSITMDPIIEEYRMYLGTHGIPFNNDTEIVIMANIDDEDDDDDEDYEDDDDDDPRFKGTRLYS